MVKGIHRLPCLKDVRLVVKYPVALLLAMAVLSSRAWAQPTPVTVMPFASRAGESQAWLAKGLADLFSRHLAEIPTLAVLERERLQAFLNEMELGQEPLFDQTQALRLGRVAKIKEVLYGSYELHGRQLSVTVFWLDLDKQRVLATAEATGSLDALVPLVQKLTEQVLQKRGSPLATADEARLHLHVTDSISALEHFYRGLDAYDRWLLPDALGEMLSAAQEDPRYLDARVWVGRLFEAQGYDDHAVLAYRQLFHDYPRDVEAWDALLFAARLMREQLHTPEQALALLKTVMQLAPASPEGLEASFLTGLIQEERKNKADAYKAFRYIERFMARTADDQTQSFRAESRPSRFFGWPHALSLYADAMVHSILLYKDLIQAGQTPTAPRGLLTFLPEHPVFLEDRYRTTPSLFIERHDEPAWKEDFYVAAAPPGYEIQGVELMVTGELHEMKPNRDYTLRVLPFPVPRDFMNRWLGAIYGQTPQMTTLKKNVSFHGANRRLVTLQLIENGSTIKDWGVTLRLRKMPSSPAVTGRGPMDSSPATAGNDDLFYEGRLVAQAPLSNRIFSQATRSSVSAYYAPARKLALAVTPDGHPMLVTVRGELGGDPTDLYFSSSTQGKSWSAPQPLSLNSAAEDFDPRLIEAEDGKLRLAWLSNRRGRGWELWMSALELTRRTGFLSRNGSIREWKKSPINRRCFWNTT